MEVYVFENEKGYWEVRKLLKIVVDSRHLLPVLGAGFSVRVRTACGEVPGVDALKNEITGLLLQCKDFHGRKKEDFSSLDLSQLASVFWRVMDKAENKLLLSRFQQYISDNFTKVRDLEQSKRKFLNLGWRYIYTLNYDDAIERNIDIDVIIPYDRQNKDYIDQHTCLFKLHGDAGRYVRTGDSKFCILSKQQYLTSMKAEENYDMCKHLETVFAGNNLLFVGCGLKNELDLMFAAETGLQRRIGQDEDRPKIIYLYYSENIVEELPLEESLRLEEYGVTHVILVHGEEGMNRLYQLLYELHDSLKTLKKQDELENYKGIYFKQLGKDDRDNLEYFFLNKQVALTNGTITLPGFFIERTLGKEIRKNISGIEVLQIVTGSRLSGKTYLLLQLARILPPESTYYLYMPIQTELLEKMLSRQNCVFLLDQGTLSIDQIKSLFDKLDILRRRNIRIVLTLNLDDQDFLRVYAENRFRDKLKNCFHVLKNKLDDKEMAQFNINVAKLHLVDYQPHDTILDFLFKLEGDLFTRRKEHILPPVKFLGDTSGALLKAMIVLAVEKTVPLKLAMGLNITEALYSLCQRYEITVQKDYLTEIETRREYSLFKFLNNSPYWVLRCLSECARNPVNHKAIADAYVSIVSDFNKFFGTNVRLFNQKIKEYYKLDNLQLFFAVNDQKGVLLLPYTIYERLHSMLYNNNQFLHQEAKCELRMARRKETEDEILAILEKAYMNMKRAIGLTEALRSENKQYTLTHMKVTKALILSNYLLIGKKEDRVDETIQVYYEAFVENSMFLDDDFLKKDDLKDVRGFLNYILQRKDALQLSRQSKEQFGIIYEKRYGKHVSL